MNIIRFTGLTAILVLATTAADAAAKIYKSVDKDGNTTFTDVPPAKADDGVEFSEINSYAAQSKPEVTPTATIRRTAFEPTEDISAEDEGESLAFSYQSISVAAPQNEASLRDNAGNVTISVAMSPPLQTDKGHRTEVLLDGAVASKGSNLRVELNNVDRGTHVVSARIVDAGGNTLLISEPSTFHLQRHSIQHKRPQPKRAP